MRAAALTLAGLATTVAAPDADGCTYAYQTPQFIVGAAELPQNAKLLVAGNIASVRHLELWLQGAEHQTRTGTRAPSRVSRRASNLGTYLVQVTPQEPLPVGSEATLWSSEHDEPNARWDRVAAWRVGPVREVTPPAAPARIVWFADRLDRTTQDCEGPYEEVAHLQIEPPAEGPAQWYEVRGVSSSGQTQTWAAHSSRAMLFSQRHIECVEVRGVEIDGTVGPTARTCAPDRCVLRPGGDSYRRPDWDSVAEPCNLDCTPRAEGGYECTGPGVGGHAGDGGEDLDAGGCACHTLEPAPHRGALAVFVGGLAVAVVGRRRSRR